MPGACVCGAFDEICQNFFECARMLISFRFFVIFFACQMLLFQAWAGSLSELIRDGISSHPSIRAQGALERAAERGVSAARWQYFPTPSVGMERVASSKQSLVYGHGDDSVTTMRLQQPLWTGGRLSAGLAKAEVGVVLGRAGVGVAKHELALRIIQAYAEWHGGAFRRLAYEKSLRSHLRLRQQILRRIQEGVSPKTDLTLVDGRVEQTRGELIAAQVQQSTALSRLSQILGRPVLEDELMAVVARPLAIGAAQEMAESAQEVNPVVARMVATAQMQRLEIDERRADLSPEVYLRLERQYGNFSFRGAQPENRAFFGVSTRFGAGLSALSGVDVARSRYEASLADIDGARVALTDQVYADQLQVESGNGRLLALNASLSLAEATSQAWDRQFLAGQKSWLDVMNAVREVAQVETQIADVNSAQLLMTWRLVLFAKGLDALLEREGVVVPAVGSGVSISDVSNASAMSGDGLVLRLETALRWFFASPQPDAASALKGEKREKSW